MALSSMPLRPGLLIRQCVCCRMGRATNTNRRGLRISTLSTSEYHSDAPASQKILRGPRCSSAAMMRAMSPDKFCWSTAACRRRFDTSGGRMRRSADTLVLTESDHEKGSHHTRHSERPCRSPPVKITDIECFVLLVPDYSAQACSSAQDNLVVKIHTDSGHVGIGETDTNPWVARAMIEARGTHCMGLGLKETLVGADPTDIEGLWERLYIGSAMTGRRGVGICAIGAL